VLPSASISPYFLLFKKARVIPAYDGRRDSIPPIHSGHAQEMRLVDATQENNMASADRHASCVR
jgi:hypothetical protein